MFVVQIQKRRQRHVHVAFVLVRHCLPKTLLQRRRQLSQGEVWLHEAAFSEHIRGTAHALQPLGQHVRVNLRRFHVIVAEQFLNDANIVAGFQKVGRPAKGTG